MPIALPGEFDDLYVNMHIEKASGMLYSQKIV